MKRIVVASKNPVKINAVRSGFEKMFPKEAFTVKALSVPSGVSEQPMDSETTLQGAVNRVENAMQADQDSDYWVGVEGGIESIDTFGMSAFAWIVVQSKTERGVSRTGTFYLPEKVAKLVRGGTELGYANDMVFDKSNSKQNSGAIGLLTGDVVDRTALYEHAVVLALVRFRNKELYVEAI